MYINFVPDLFLEVAELVRFRESLDDSGFRNALLENSVNFGLIKSILDPTFNNGRIERDVDNSLNQKTIKIGAISGIDSLGQFITLPQTNNFPVPSDTNWYWVRARFQYSTLEKGIVTIDASGNMTGVGTEFTKILRSNQNFPSFISFVNSTGNTLEYEIGDITDDFHAVLINPAITVGGTADFYAEANLNYQIVGTFTEGVEVPMENKYPFKYDSCLIDLVMETTPNVKPTFVPGQEFYLARVSVNAGNLVIQDKRNEYWESKGSEKAIDIERSSNSLIGVESVQWQNTFNTGDRNIVNLAFGMRSTNWSVDSSQNIVTFFGSSTGGSFKTTDDFTDGDFNGWRLYANNGTYRTIVNSIKQGSAINNYLDVLDVDDYSTDGGITFTGDLLLIVPNADSVEIAFLSKTEVLPADNVLNVNDDDKFIFNINTPVAKCLPTVYLDPVCSYVVLYRYKAFKEFTKWSPITSGSYFTEDSFTINGALKPSDERIINTYTASATVAFIQLQMSPYSWNRFKGVVYKGDTIGVNTIINFVPGQVVPLIVNTSKYYQHITGDISISSDIYISLERIGAVQGNKFFVHIDCNSLALGANKIIIADNYSSGVLTTLKEITTADAYAMQNKKGGLFLTFTFDELGKWIMAQDYELGQPFQITMFDGVVTDFFDSGLQGKVQGYFGWEIYTVMTGRMPIGYGVYTDDSLTAPANYTIGNTGGRSRHTLSVEELASHDHPITATDRNIDFAGAGHVPATLADGTESGGTTDLAGGDQSHENMSPYRVVAFIKRKY